MVKKVAKMGSFNYWKIVYPDPTNQHSLRERVVGAVVARRKLWTKILARFSQIFRPTHVTPKLAILSPTDPTKRPQFSC